MTHIPPTIGRVLLFHPCQEVAGVVYDKDQPFNASVCFVHNDRLINISYNDHRGLAYTAQSVILVQDGDAAPEEQAYCTWMAYQIGQAAKVEALQQQLGSGQGTMPGTAFSGETTGAVPGNAQSPVAERE